MSLIFNKIAAAFRALTFNLQHPKDPNLAALFGNGDFTESGVNKTPLGFLEIPGIFAAIRTVSYQVATLPIKLYKRDRETRQIDREHYLYPILHDMPNLSDTAWEFKQVMTTWLMVYQNAYAIIGKSGISPVTSLTPVCPSDVQIIKKGREIQAYSILTDGIARNYGAEDILHLRGFSWDGIAGLETWRHQREPAGLSKVLEGHASRFFKNGAKPGMTLTHPGKMGMEALDRMKKQIASALTGGNAYKTLILEEGMKAEKLSINNNESQFVESRAHQLNELSRVIGIQPHLIGDLSRATFSNIEAQGIDFLSLTLNPILTMWEQAIYRDLLTKEGRKTHFAEFDRSGVVQADIKTKTEAYRTGILSGIYSINEIRAKENLAPVEGGDQHMVQSQMVNVTGVQQNAGA